MIRSTELSQILVKCCFVNGIAELDDVASGLPTGSLPREPAGSAGRADLSSSTIQLDVEIKSFGCL